MHPSIHESAVIIREDIEGVQNLVAYLVPEVDGEPKQDEVRDYLKQSLPDYMIPTSFMYLQKMPLTSNEKVDKSKLPKPNNNPNDSNKHLLPHSDIEKTIAEIWKKLLNIQAPSLKDNFFDLGGHSLMSLQAIHMIEQETGVRIAPSELIFQTLGQIANRIQPSNNEDPLENAPTYENINTFYFGNEKCNLYGCIHFPSTHSNNTKGVVLCNPIGQDYIRSHRALRVLASKLVGDGHTVLRYDHFGTGNSKGEFEEVSFQECYQNLSEAIEYLRNVKNVTNISLIGVRFGASIIAKYSMENKDIEEIVLWDPIFNGQEYLSELEDTQKSVYDLNFLNPSLLTELKNKYGLESEGYMYGHKLINELNHFDITLPKIIQAKKLLYISSGTENRCASFYHALNNMNIKCNELLFNGKAVWKQEPDYGIVPFSIIEAITEWKKMN